MDDTPTHEAPEGQGLPPAPDDMPVHIDHDGVDWRDGYGVIDWRAALLLGGLLLVVLSGFLLTMAPLSLSLPVAAASLLPLAAAAAQGGPRVVTLRPDRLWLGAPPHRTEILLDDLQGVRVSLPDTRQSCLVLVTREGRFPLGLGAPEAHLRWFAAAIEQARRHDANTDAAAGHELFFHREEPEAFQRGPSDEERHRQQRLGEGRRRE